MAGTSSLTRIWPASAAVHSRDASTTGVPNQSLSSSVASPTDTPMRRARPRLGWRRARVRMDRCIEMAADTESVAEKKAAIRPSPRLLISVPPWTTTA